MSRTCYTRSFAFTDGPALALLAGRKTASVRRRTTMTPKPGRQVRCTVKGRTIALAEIASWENLTCSAEQAIACGHDTPDEMRAAVARYYPHDTPERLVVVHLTAIAPVCGHSLMEPGTTCAWCGWRVPTNEGAPT